MKKGWYLTTAPIITANWRANDGNVWTVPFGGGVGRVMKLGFQPVNITAVLWQRCASRWSFPLGYALAICVAISQADQSAGEMLLENKLKQMEQEESAEAVNR